MIRSLRLLALCLLTGATLAAPAPARAQQPTRDPDLNADALQPEFSLATLPTTLRLPRFRSAFRVTHRFGRPLGSGDFGDLASDFFGLDSGAQIGLEYRYGLMPGTQIGVQVTPLFIDGLAMMKLKITVTSSGVNQRKDLPCA